jgi:hypothetical protein
MRKFSVYFACFFTLVLILMGCGDTSGDPTAQITLKAEKTDVSPGGSVVITATVVKAVGTKADATGEATVTAPGWGENVAFKLLTANGGQLSTSIQKTDGNGVALTVYTAGNNYSNDTIQATLDNGMSASIVITKTGAIIGARISKLETPTPTVAENQTAVITATVTNQETNQPMMGEAVTFTIPTNASGACFINANNACVSYFTVTSDASGKAVAIYRAGGNDSTQEVYDTVRAALTNGSTNAVVITRKTGPAGPVLVLTASPTTVGEGQTSVITATVSGGASKGANETVTLTIPVNYSGASFINATGASVSTVTIRTGNGGIASAIYRAGANDSGTTVQDTVEGVLSNGAMNAVSITRSAGPAGAILVLTASPTTVGDGQTSVITATVTGGTSVGTNETVTLTIPVNYSGASFINSAGVGVTTITITTGNNGIATAIYRAGAINSGTTVQDTVQGVLSNGAVNAVTITRSASPAGAVLVLTASPTTVGDGQTSIITATVSGGTNSGVGETVTLTIPLNYSGGSFIKTAGVGVTTITITTGIGGTASAVYRAGANNSGTTVQDTIQGVLSNGAVNAVTIIRSAGTPPSGMSLSLTASPNAVSAGQTSVITATVTGGLSSGAKEPVTLTIPVNSSGASFINAAGASMSTITITTGSGGTASAIYKAGTNISGTSVQDTIQGVISNGAVNAATIRVSAGVTGYIVTVTASPSTIVAPLAYPHKGVSLITANVKDNTGTAYVGASVEFFVTIGAGVGNATVTSPATTDGNGNAFANYASDHSDPTYDIITARATIGGVIYTGATTITVP